MPIDSQTPKTYIIMLGLKGILKINPPPQKKKMLPGSGHFDYRWNAGEIQMERSDIYFSSYRFNKEFLN